MEVKANPKLIVEVGQAFHDWIVSVAEIGNRGHSGRDGNFAIIFRFLRKQCQQGRYALVVADKGQLPLVRLQQDVVDDGGQVSGADFVPTVNKNMEFNGDAW